MRLRFITLFFALSFWSSGVALIRVLEHYGVWQDTLLVGAMFVVTIALVYVSVKAMRRIYARWYTETTTPLSLLVATVLIIHGLAISVYPALYGAPVSLLEGAWLLWFGGWALLAINSKAN